MTDQNNASETSGEAEIVAKLKAHDLNICPDWNDDADRNVWIDTADALLSEAAETIERLVAERLVAERNRYKFNADELRQSRKRQAQRYHRITSELIDRAEAAENRIAELESVLAIATENSQRLEKQSYDLLEQVTELSADFKREEFNRAHWKKKAEELEAERDDLRTTAKLLLGWKARANAAEKRITELEADLQRAMQALGHVRNMAELMMHGDVSYLNAILDTIRAALKGKKL